MRNGARRPLVGETIQISGDGKLYTPGGDAVVLREGDVVDVVGKGLVAEIVRHPVSLNLALKYYVGGTAPQIPSGNCPSRVTVRSLAK